MDTTNNINSLGPFLLANHVVITVRPTPRNTTSSAVCCRCSMDGLFAGWLTVAYLEGNYAATTRAAHRIFVISDGIQKRINLGSITDTAMIPKLKNLD